MSDFLKAGKYVDQKKAIITAHFSIHFLQKSDGSITRDRLLDDAIPCRTAKIWVGFSQCINMGLIFTIYFCRQYFPFFSICILPFYIFQTSSEKCFLEPKGPSETTSLPPPQVGISSRTPHPPQTPPCGITLGNVVIVVT